VRLALWWAMKTGEARSLKELLMDRTQQNIDQAYWIWQRQQRKVDGEKPILACSSDVACSIPVQNLSKPKTSAPEK